MSTITTLNASDTGSVSRPVINTNFDNLDTDKLENVVEDTTPQLGGNLDMNSNNIEGVTPAEVGYVSGVTSAIQTQLNAKVGDTGNETIAGVKTFSSFPVSPSSAPTTDYQVANKKYVDDNAGSAPEGTAVLSTGETVGKVLQADGDDSSSWVTLPGGGDALTTNPLSQFAATTSAQLAGVLSDETGSGAAVFATSPTLVTPALGTPSALVGTNISGTASSLEAGTVSSISGLAPDTATTQATQANITTCANLTTVGTVATGNVDAVVSASSKTTAGKVELATTAEIDTGTDTTRAIPVDQFVASKRNIRWLAFNLVEAGTDCAAATNIAGDFLSPIAGTILQSDSSPFYLYATNSTAGVTGTMVVDISIGGTSIMTTNKLDFDTTEKTTTTAATPPDLTTTSISVGDIITIDIDSVHTTAAKGLTVYMAIRE